MTTDQVPVAVVGAGPYGLSVSAHLTGRRVEHRVFGEPMAFWAERMPQGMYLKSEGHASNLGDPGRRSTLARFCSEGGIRYGDMGVPVALSTFVDYGRWFAQREVPDAEPLDVVGLTPAGDRFELALSDGTTVTAGRVVLATGVGTFDHVPEVLAGLPPQLVSHSSAHADLTRFAGRDVVLVGGGQSALEGAALLAEAGARPLVLVRAGEVKWNKNPAGRGLASRLRYPNSKIGTSWSLRIYSERPDTFRHLPAQRRSTIVATTLGPAGSWWLRERISGVVPVRVACSISQVRPSGDGVELTVRGPGGEETVHADHVIAGTGYRVDLARLPILDPELRRRITTFGGYPVLDARFGSSVPGLHFVGLPAAHTFGPVQRFVAGADFAARRVAGAIGGRPRTAVRIRSTAAA